MIENAISGSSRDRSGSSPISSPRFVTRQELAAYAESRQLPTQEIFAFEKTRVSREEAFAIIQRASSLVAKANDEAGAVADTFLSLAKFKLEALYGADRAPSLLDILLIVPGAYVNIDKLLARSGEVATNCHLRFLTKIVFLQVVREFEIFSSNPVSWIAASCKSVAKDWRVKSLTKANLLNVSEALKSFARMVAKLPPITFPSKERIRSYISLVDQLGQEHFTDLMLQAKGLDRAVSDVHKFALELANSLDELIVTNQPSDISLFNSGPSRELRKVVNLLGRLAHSLLEMNVIYSKAGGRSSFLVRAAFKRLRELDESTSPVSVSNSGANVPSSNIPAVRFEEWWEMSSKIIPPPREVSLILQAINLLLVESPSPSNTRQLGVIRTELEKITPLERLRLIDNLTIDGDLSLEVRRKTEGWLLGEDLVKRGIVQLSRDLLKPFISDRELRGSLVLAGGDSLPIAKLEERANAIMAFTEALMDTNILSTDGIGSYLIRNPEILRSGASEIEELAVVLLELDAKLGKLPTDHALVEATRERLSLIENQGSHGFLEQATALSVDIARQLQILKPVAVEPREMPLTEPGKPLRKDSPSKDKPISKTSPLAVEFDELLNALKQDRVCSRWDSRELLCVVASFYKKRQIWVGESYTRTEYLRKNSNALLGAQIEGFSGMLRFLSRERVVGHLGYKGGCTVASLNPSLEEISNPALRKVASYLRKMTDVSTKAEIVSLIKG
jgi:hypothetical protein